MLDFARKDPLEALADQAFECFEECEVRTTGFAINKLLSKTLSFNFNYANNYSEQTSGPDKGETINYTPEHSIKLGINWTHHNGFNAVTKLNYLSKMHKDALKYSDGLSWMVDISKETKDKRFKIFAIAAYNDILKSRSYFLGTNYRF